MIWPNVCVYVLIEPVVVKADHHLSCKDVSSMPRTDIKTAHLFPLLMLLHLTILIMITHDALPFGPYIFQSITLSVLAVLIKYTFKKFRPSEKH